MKTTYTQWDIKYAMLIQRIVDKIPMSEWNTEEKELFAYCVKEGFLEVSEVDEE